jgi:hypothetical protein
MEDEDEESRSTSPPKPDESKLLSAFESKQASALQEMQNRMQKELDVLKSKVASEHVSIYVIGLSTSIKETHPKKLGI